MNNVGIINYGMGNIGSIVNILKKVGAAPLIFERSDGFEEVSHLVLPGVGAFENAMVKLEAGGWLPVLEKHALEDKKPFMGICLGMQLMTESSEESGKQGLGWIKGRTVHFDAEKMDRSHRIPHMGWNIAKVQKKNSFFDPDELEERFYFVHSYHVMCEQEDILTTTDYGYTFVSAFQRENILGVQFHPEKSHRFGMKLFKRFVEDF